MRLSFIAAASFLTLLTPSSALADLIGSNVIATLYFPNLSTINSGPIGPVVVGPGVEFPTGPLAFDGQVDVTGSQIIWTATSSEHYGSGAFNGFDFVFSGAPAITNVTVDPSSTLPAVSFSFSGNEVLLNLEGEIATAGQQTILDVQTSAGTVPEPALGFMTGLVLLAFVSFQARRITSKSRP